MGLLEVIEYHDPTGNEIAHKIPEQGSAETRLGSQLVVREYQVAVFFRDGKGLDVLGPGRHTLTTQNIPVLAKLVGLAFDDRKSPFRTEVIYVSQKVFHDMKWGTKEPVPFRDSELGYVQLRAFGAYTMRIKDPLLFINTLVAGRGRFATADVANFLRDVIVSRLNDILGETLKTIFALASMYDEIGVAAKLRMAADFEKYGIELIDFYINAITPPEEVQKAINERSSMGALGDMNRFMQYKTAQAMGDAAKNQGNVGGAMGAGLGAGLGMAIPQMMMNQMNQSHAPTPGQPAADASGAKAPLADRLQKLKSLFDQSLITAEEYEAKRKEILAEL